LHHKKILKTSRRHSIFFFIKEINNSVGKIKYAITRLSSENGISGSGNLAILKFRPKLQGTTYSNLTDIKIADPNSQPITYGITNGISKINIATSNNAPVLNPIGNKEVSENALLTFSISASDPDNDVLAYSASDLPSGASFSGQTFTWIPTFAQAGTYSTTFTVSDGKGGVANETIIIIVNNVNRNPTINSYLPISDITIAENSSQAFSITASDPDGDMLSYSWFLDEAQVSTAPSFTYSPDYNAAGVHILNVTVSDGSLKTSHSWNINVLDTNRAPIFSTIGSKNVNEDSLLEFTILANDPDGDSVSYMASGLPSGASFLGQKFSWKPSFIQSGVYTVTFIAMDQKGASSNQSMQITVNNINRVPTITSYYPLSDPIINEGSTQDFRISAEDPDNDYLIYKLWIDNNFILNTNSYIYTTNSSSVGIHIFNLTVGDGSSSTGKSWKVTVNKINRAPSIISTPVTTATENAAYSYQVVGSDPDGDALTYSLTAAPAGMTIDSTKGLISWIPDFEQSGTHSVIVRVTDTAGLTGDQSFTITVANTNRDPVFTSIVPSTNPTVAENSSQVFSVTASDPDGDTLSYSWMLDGNEVSIINSFNYYMDYNSAGLHNVTVLVSDGINTISKEWNVNITNRNRAPILNWVSLPEATEGVPYSFQINASDPDNDELEFLLLSGPEGMQLDSNTGVINWTPNYNQSGSYNLSINITDGIASQNAIMWIYVNDNKKPNLKIGNVTAKTYSSSLSEGRAIFRFSIKNDGDKVSENVNWQIITPYGIKTSTSAMNISAGSEAIVYTKYEFPKKGMYNITLIADSDNTVDEYNESDNLKEFVVNIK